MPRLRGPICATFDPFGGQLPRRCFEYDKFAVAESSPSRRKMRWQELPFARARNVVRKHPGSCPGCWSMIHKPFPIQANDKLDSLPQRFQLTQGFHARLRLAGAGRQPPTPTSLKVAERR